MTTAENGTRTVALGVPSLGEREAKAAADVFATGWVAGQGPATRAFEAAFAERCGVEHAIAVNNCTAGLHLALLALGVGDGDEVIVADYTFPATGHSVLYCGATPVFCDVRADTATLDASLLSGLATNRTKGVIVVDALGQVADYDDIEAIASERGWFVLEDAACSAGASYHGRPTGSFGDVAAFSLHGRKGITCGEGGVVTTNDRAIADKVRKLSCFGMESAFARQASDTLALPVFDEVGYNYKLSDILAAIAHVQLQRLDELVARRREAARWYDELLAPLGGITTPARPADREHVLQTFAVTVDDRLDRDRLVLNLRSHGVQCNIGTYASHVQPVYGDVAVCPVSARLFRQHLALPMHAELIRDDVEYVVSVLAQAIAEQA